MIHIIVRIWKYLIHSHPWKQVSDSNIISHVRHQQRSVSEVSDTSYDLIVSVSRTLHWNWKICVQFLMKYYLSDTWQLLWEHKLIQTSKISVPQSCQLCCKLCKLLIQNHSEPSPCNLEYIRIKFVSNCFQTHFSPQHRQQERDSWPLLLSTHHNPRLLYNFL